MRFWHWPSSWARAANALALPPTEPASAKKVFAHYMVCCPMVGGSATLDDYKREIQEAQQRGIDGVALNCRELDEKRAALQGPHASDV